MSNHVAKPLPTEDLDHILAHTKSLWDELAGKRIFITGGTGFFGIWLLETIAYANDQLGIGVNATVLSRDPEYFLERFPHLARRKEFTWLRGHPATFSFPSQPFDFLLHLATFTSAHGDETEPLEMLKMKMASILHTLDFARYANVKRMLVTSSGAVYGRQALNLEHIPESYQGAPDPLDAGSAYGNGKRLVEQICALYTNVDTILARCFAFIGPHLPLDGRFAAGNFIRDALAGDSIVVQSDGRAVRSYLHACDLTIYLLTILLHGKRHSAYNVGSDQAICIGDFARRFAELKHLAVDIQAANNNAPPSATRYVPDISRAAAELALRPTIDLNEAIARTMDWHKIAGA